MPIDVPLQVEYWRASAREDIAAATVLLDHAQVRHALFFAHLAVEKALKAHVCQQTQMFRRAHTT